MYDFGMEEIFPALYGLKYGPPGAPDVAARAAELLRGAGFDAGLDANRTLDHGTSTWAWARAWARFCAVLVCRL